jgi:hypothetical protein
VTSLTDGATRRIRPFGVTDSTAGIVGGAPRVVGGRLYWLAQDVVLSAAFDAQEARLTSEPSPVVSGVRGDLFGAADFDLADDGTVVFVAGADPSIGHLAWLEAKGGVDTLALPPANYAGFDLSPDGRSLLTKVINSSGTAEIRVFDIAAARALWSMWVPEISASLGGAPMAARRWFPSRLTGSPRPASFGCRWMVVPRSIRSCRVASIGIPSHATGG